jgi:hypothetical protein
MTICGASLIRERQALAGKLTDITLTLVCRCKFYNSLFRNTIHSVQKMKSINNKVKSFNFRKISNPQGEIQPGSKPVDDTIVSLALGYGCRKNSSYTQF